MRLVLVSLLLLAPMALAWAPVATTIEECGVVFGLGPACPVPGGYEIEIAGARRFTHGPDPVPAAEAFALAASAAPRDPACIDDPLTEYHAQVIYAHPADKPNRGAELASTLQDLIAEANGLMYMEGALLGAGVDYRFLCDDAQRPAVHIATIPVATGQGDYTTLTTALTAMGFTNGHAKYWVWYDDPSACTCGGIAAAPLDTRRDPHNNANGGGYFGATYGYFSARILMHENGHNLGAVADAAPDSSGAAHCNDGWDVMCYADGGPTANYRGNVCADRQYFDCDHDTYFHPDPPAGTWVARRWNLAAPINRYVEGCLYADEPIRAPGLAVDVVVPQACAGHLYAIYGRSMAAASQHVAGQSPVAVSVNEFAVCWHSEDALLGCPENTASWGHEGRVPEGATRAVVTWLKGENGRFTLSAI